MALYDYKTVSYARPQKALPTNDPIDFSDYKTVSYARPQAGGTTNNPMVSDTAKAEAILGPQYQRARKQTIGTIGSLVDRMFGGGTTSSSSGSIWRDLGSIAGKTSGQMSGSLSNYPFVYMTVSYARPQKEVPTNNPMVSDTAKEVLNPVGTTSSSSDSIWGDLGNIAGKYESALGEAEAILGPQYQRARKQTMSEVDKNMVSRGFYGQAPGDAIRASTLTDLDMAYQAALGNYATNIMDRRAQMDLQKYMFDTDVMDRRAQMDLQKYMFEKEMEEYKKAQMDLQKYMFDKGLEEQWKMFEKEMQEQRQQSKDRKKSSLNLGIGTVLGGLFGGPAGAAIGTGIGNILSSIFG